jgi:hypothetical protein
LPDLRAAASGAGLNLLGVVDAHAYDAAAPAKHRLRDAWSPARSALVFGSAGPAFWDRFCDHLGAPPLRSADAHPLDAFTIACLKPLRALVHRQGLAERTLYPFDGARDHAVSFQKLAMAAGFGAQSVLGLVLHPEFGPWVAARAAILTDALLRPTKPLSAFDPCNGCASPCVDACPGDAFPDHQWSASICLEAKRTVDACRQTCLSRINCVFGHGSRYSAEEMAYHSTLPESLAKTRGAS